LSYYSESWKESIEKTIQSIITNCSKKNGYKYVNYYPERIKDIFLNYEIEMRALKDNIFKNYPLISKNKKEEDLIDHHKIIALYIKSFLKANPIEFDNKKYDEDYIKDNPILTIRLIKEMICFSFVVVIINAWNKKNIPDFELKIPKNYHEHFYKLIYYYSNRPDDLPVLGLSHIFYLLEMNSQCLFFHKIPDYFDIQK